MRQWIADLISEGGAVSAMRFMSITTVISACLVALYAAYAGRDLIGSAALVTSLLVPAFGGKALQKGSENGEPK